MPPGRRRAGPLLCAALSLLILAGCTVGDGGSEGTATPTETAVPPETGEAGAVTVTSTATDDGLSTATSGPTSPTPTDVSGQTETGEAGSTEPVTTTAPRVSAPPPATVPPDELREARPADDLVAPVVSAQAEALTNPEDLDTDELADVADGTMLDQIRAIASDYALQGWTQVGAPEIVRSAIVDVNERGEPPTARAEVCLDHSSVDIVDASGQSVRNPDAEMRVLTIYELEYSEGRWRVVRQTFPDDTDC